MWPDQAKMQLLAAAITKSYAGYLLSRHRKTA